MHETSVKSNINILIFITSIFTTTSANALMINIGGNTIIDGSASDTNTTTGVIDFSLLNVTGSSGIYNISGTLSESITGTSSVSANLELALTNLDIKAISGNVSDSISFRSTDAPTYAADTDTLRAKIDGNWTSGNSNAATTVSDGDIRLGIDLIGDWSWNGDSGINEPFLNETFFGDPLLSNDGNTFNDNRYGIPGIPSVLATEIFAGAFITQADWSQVGGTLEFSLANIDDGLWLPGSVDITLTSSTAVPLPASLWLMLTGLAMLRFATSKNG